ncbi:hypothetical protein ANCCAN_11994 [Ancylostoma caninum]|uniref:Uncharacterized protein n=1 Tax=Ancylostoma caninum TaxID=29170 RepID=A0A368GCB9_ANCCA|nr:hypothetical protein ANCCAN_11994 [Ancylostoma caninum]
MQNMSSQLTAGKRAQPLIFGSSRFIVRILHGTHGIPFSIEGLSSHYICLTWCHLGGCLFENKQDTYLQAARIVEFLHKWECFQGEASACTVLLAEEFSKEGFWDDAEAELIKEWVHDLRTIGYQFPTRSNHTGYAVREDIRGANCRRANVEFERKSANTVEKKSAEKLKLFDELADWCGDAASSDVLHKMPSPRHLAKSHAESRVLTNLEKSVGGLFCTMQYLSLILQNGIAELVGRYAFLENSERLYSAAKGARVHYPRKQEEKGGGELHPVAKVMSLANGSSGL